MSAVPASAVSRRVASPASPSSRSRATSSSASARSRRAPLTRLALVIATAFGAGYAPIAPGTAGSAVALVILWLVPFSQLGLIIFFLAVTFFGTWAAEVAEAAVGDKDPGVIVIDEVAGMTLSVLVLPLTIPVLLTGFVLFRIFDVVKPFPANRLQALHGGVGVMIDDLVAGVYALLILIALRAVVGWP
jgi:phosphatidylglycerophosphatase A